MSLFQKQTEKIPTSYEERIAYILQRVLMTEGYVKLSELAEEMYVSKSTVNLIMKDVTDICGRYKLQIEKRPYYGIRIVGENLIFVLVYHNMVYRVMTILRFMSNLSRRRHIYRYRIYHSFVQLY